MTLTAPAVVLAYLITLPTLAIALSRRGKGNPAQPHHDLPAWAICLSIVATETSTLTVISVPGIAYTRSMAFVGLAIGYLIGRIAVALWFLPLYQTGGLQSAYQYLGTRFGPTTQRLASASFLLTRLLAEAVRLFAGMLPIASLTASTGLISGTGPTTQWAILILIMGLTALYTLLGGLRAVIWSDTIQLLLYLTGAIACIAILTHRTSTTALTHALTHAHLFTHHTPLFTNAFTPAAAILGGAILTLASHGTDQLMIQRCLAARSLNAARAAMIGSALLVALLFASLSLIGIMSHETTGQTFAQRNLPGPDALFPHIIQTMPPVLSGLLVAGILAATMGSLSSALNAMTGAILGDFSTPAETLRRRLALRPETFSRLITAFWAILLILAARSFSQGSHSAVLFALSITAYCYAGILGMFVLGMIDRTATTPHALTAFLTTLATIALITLHPPGGHPIAFSWLVPLGLVTALASGTFAKLIWKPRQPHQPPAYCARSNT